MKKVILELTNTDTDYNIDEDQEIVATFDGTGDKSIKTKLNFIHTKPHITSRILIKAVLKDSSRFDFEGVLQIHKGASGTDTYLKIDCLLVSDKAYARAIPSLEITENEVKGGHGATIGYIDPEQMYYLMSKGLSTKVAEDEIVKAFLS
jgi:Fe-S cluster assembly scaffold protein SufB